jgi:catalase
MYYMNDANTQNRILKYLTMALTSLVLLACNGSQHDELQLGEEWSSSEEAEETAAMIDAIKAVSMQRNPDGVVKRFNQAKGLGCFDATFTVAADLPGKLKQGIFATEKTFPARIRFANASEFDDTKKDFRGMSIKLFNVPGVSLWGKSGQQDFLLNSYPALFAANPADFLDFIEATRDDKVWRYFINPRHFYSLKVVLQGREKIDDPFAIRYWSTTPYRYGDDKSQAVKYSVQPCSATHKKLSVNKDKDFLSQAMVEHLRQQPACFDFMVQFQQDPLAMPIEDASVIWDEAVSPFIKVATITINDQDFTKPSNVEDCEAMRFNPWQSIAAHQPLGGINRVRKPVYSEIGDFRQAENNRRNIR